MASAEKRPPVEENPKKPTPEKKRKAPKEGLKRKQGINEVKESKKAKKKNLENKNVDVEEVLHNIVMRLTNHSRMGVALWFEVGEDLRKFFIKELCLITDMKCLSNSKLDNDDDAVKLGLLYVIFCIPLATRVVIRNVVTRLSSKRRPLKKADKVYYSITGFPHALLIWACGSIPTIAGEFTTKHIEANLSLLSWTSTDNVKFDAVMSALTVVERDSRRGRANEQKIKQAKKRIEEVQKAPTHKMNAKNDDSDAMKTDSDDFRFGPQDDGSLTLTSVTLQIKEAKDEDKEYEEEDEEEEENEYDEGENDEEDEDEEKEDDDEEGKNNEGKEEEKNDEEAKGEEDQRNDEEVAMEQDKEERKYEEATKEQEKNINDQSGSVAHALTKMVKVYALLQGILDEPPKENLEQFRHIDVAFYYLRKKIMHFPKLLQRKVTTVDTFFRAKIGALWPVYKKAPDKFDWGSCDSLMKNILGVITNPFTDS
ncbi:hypothetical protein TIFTF001_023302 [Ficus carica]|uniref:Uncharacterized protein n=1 Tax=Ficus carica TaxID=3494 RepID=A0AA88AFX7_FICCA|nr:hypothetical protein TIFTF001_023302 [Ficus carica]